MSHENTNYPGLVPYDDEGPELTMSSLEIAKLTDWPHDRVMRIIRRTLEVLHNDPARFLRAHTGDDGAPGVSYRLPREECEDVIDCGAAFTEEQDNAILRRWDQMEALQKVEHVKAYAERLRAERAAREAAKLPPAVPHDPQPDATVPADNELIIPFREFSPSTAVVGLPGAAGQPKTMSSLEIAEVTGKDHANVLKDIRRILEEAGIDAVRFNGVYLGGNGQERPCYHLPPAGVRPGDVRLLGSVSHRHHPALARTGGEGGGPRSQGDHHPGVARPQSGVAGQERGAGAAAPDPDSGAGGEGRAARGPAAEGRVLRRGDGRGRPLWGPSFGIGFVLCCSRLFEIGFGF